MTNTTPGNAHHGPACLCEDCTYDMMLIAELEADSRAERRDRGF